MKEGFQVTATQSDIEWIILKTNILRMSQDLGGIFPYDFAGLAAFQKLSDSHHSGDVNGGFRGRNSAPDSQDSPTAGFQREYMKMPASILNNIYLSEQKVSLQCFGCKIRQT